ncbi:cobalamin-binding protein [Paenibacillus ginsengarvi]|uniref:Cobalamin-binding protein n=1 Tax=Paenibacillus ginsengarvi TaxID=400777 RepID=A0A3B0CTV1_9BACL|nr:cobalamin-binding protein [Paenibacillus ginsengarvi]RKN86814.1 cobalamin-binding protein [Paenibacillus ginsengarvi]
MRIVSLSPSNTELLGFMGLTSHIVGVDIYSDWPVSVQNLPRLGSDMNIDMDAVEALRPDLVLGSLTVPGMERNVEALKARNLPHVTLNPKKLSDISDCMKTIGEAVDALPAAKASIDRYEAMLARYEALSRQCTNRPTLYWEWWPKPVFTPGGGNWLTEISALAGAENVFANDERASVKTDWDDVLGRNPDYILLAWVGVKKQLPTPDTVAKRPGADKLDAVSGGRVLVMEEQLYCRPSPLLIAGLQKLGHQLHPDIYPAYDEAAAHRWLNESAERSI